MPAESFDALLARIRACDHCRAHLPLGPRPILQAHPDARLLIVGQAPGAKVHASGVPWDDASGARLRTWLGIDRDTFYDPCRVALVPTGFCYPGRAASGDAPPRPECAPRWHAPLLAQLRQVAVTLLIGAHALRARDPNAPALSDAVRATRERTDGIVVLPHPSPRNIAWFQRNRWFDAELVPHLRARVASALAR